MAIVLDGTTGITTPALDTATRIAPTDLGTGTPDATNFLRGDGSWQVISTTPTTDQVLTATAGAAVGAVGTYAFLLNATAGTGAIAGTTYAGSALRYSNVRASAISEGSSFSLGVIGSAPSGTWRSMGNMGATAGQFPMTLYLRVS